MEEKPLTEEQVKKLKKLHRRFGLKIAFLTFKMVFTLFVANLVVGLIDFAYVHNQVFVFLGGFLNGFMLFRSFSISLAQERDKVKEELKNILDN